MTLDTVIDNESWRKGPVALLRRVFKLKWPFWGSGDFMCVIVTITFNFVVKELLQASLDGDSLIIWFAVIR